MKYAIIAAGQGSRLAAEGIDLPKPLVPVGGIPLIGRMVAVMASYPDCEGIEVILNEEEGPRVAEYLRTLETPVPIGITFRTTPGSMHSLATLLPRLGQGPVCVATVDSVFPPEEFSDYTTAYSSLTGTDALMAVTRYVNDEKPLYVATDGSDRITGFFDTPAAGVAYVSGGIYILGPEALSLLSDCLKNGLTRMRDYQRALVAAGLDIRAFPFSRIIDVDHASDIQEAEHLSQS